MALASIGAALLMNGTLILTQSRAGLASSGITFIGLGFVAVWDFARSHSRKGALAASVAYLALVGRLSATVVPTQLPSTALVGADAWGERALSLRTLVGRPELWSSALYGIQDFPFTGMGMNTFRQVVHVLYPLFSISPEMDIGHAHNEFLQAGLDLGIPRISYGGHRSRWWSALTPS